MNRMLTALLAAGLLAPAVRAQADRDLDPARKGERTEDIEVLRRILNRALHLPDKATVTQVTVPNPGRGIMLSDGSFVTGFNSYPVGSTSFGPFDGVYLPGHGVVYTLRVPEGVKVRLDPVNKSAGLAETCVKCHTDAPKDTAPAPMAAKPATEWDRTLGELRGQKPVEPPKSTAIVATVCEPGRLTERLVEKLWRNVKHIRHLPATEHVTVVVTFDGYAGSSKSAGTSSGLESYSYPLIGRPAPADIAAQTTGDQVAGFTGEEAKLIRAADRHLEQGRPDQAVKSYQAALARVGMFGPVRVPADDLTRWKQRFPAVIDNITKSVAEVRRKLAHALTAAGQKAEGHKVLEAAGNLTLEPIEGLPATGGRPAGTVPDRPGFTPDEVRQLTLGDLHLRQNKPKEAAEAYERALSRYKSPTAVATIHAPAGLTEAQQRQLVGELVEGVRDVYAKLAQAWLAAGDTDKAAAALDIARKFKVDLVSGPTPTQEKDVPIPAKLIISVTRADALKAEDDLTAFRKVATVETVGFPRPGPEEKSKR